MDAVWELGSCRVRRLMVGVVPGLCVSKRENDAVWGGFSSGGGPCARASPVFADIPEASRWPSHELQ